MCFVIGMCLTTLPLMDFLKNKETLKYLVANFSFLNFIQPSLPGVFTNNPNQPLDGSLWTIKAELTLYVLLPFIVPLLKRSPLKVWSVIFIISCAGTSTSPRCTAARKPIRWPSSLLRCRPTSSLAACWRCISQPLTA